MSVFCAFCIPSTGLFGAQSYHPVKQTDGICEHLVMLSHSDLLPDPSQWKLFAFELNKQSAMNGNLSYVASDGFVVLKSLKRREDKAEG